MQKKTRIWSILMCVTMLLSLLPVTALANAAEPPRLSVVVLNPPKDLELSLVFTLGDEMEPVEAEAQQLAWEGYYLFRPASFPDFWDWDSSPEDMTLALVAKTGGESFSLPLDNGTLTQNTGSYYNNLCVLDLSTGMLVQGERSVRLSAREFDVMRALLQAGSANLAKESILARVWGYDSNATENHVEVYVGFLRKKLASIGSDIRIVAIRRLGYHLEVDTPC